MERETLTKKNTSFEKKMDKYAQYVDELEQQLDTKQEELDKANQLKKIVDVHNEVIEKQSGEIKHLKEQIK